MAKKTKFCPECGAELGEANICEKCGYEVVKSTQAKAVTKPTPAIEENPNWKNFESLVTTLGKWAWLIVILNGVIYLLLNIYYIAVLSAVFSPIPGVGVWISPSWIWGIISAIIEILLAIIIVRPRFSKKCATKDWDYLLNSTLKIGNFKIPWMLIWGIIVDIFGQYWGGLVIIIPALILIFIGPKPYRWTVE